MRQTTLSWRDSGSDLCLDWWAGTENKGYKGLISRLAGIQLTYTMPKSFRQELQGL